jgi:glycosyltransferase involved in cell wall biosynthesis
MRQVRVLYIVTAFPRWSGDLITPWLSETIDRLSEVGVEIEILAPAYRGLKTQIMRGITVHRFRYAPAAWETLTHDQTAPDRLRERPAYLSLVPPYLISGSIQAARLGGTKRFDLVHAFWPLPHSILGMAAKYRGRIPLVSTFFGVEFAWARAQLTVIRPILRGLVHHSDAVTAISSYTAARIKEVVPSAHPVLVPFGATVEAPRRSAAVRLPDAPYSVLFVGRLVERKGVHVLLDALHLLHAHGEIRLRIVGDGPLRSSLEARAVTLGLKRVVEFCGVVSADELARHYQESDAFVLPAVVDSKGDTEGLGVVLIEALAHGCPVIASRVGGIPDIVHDEKTGLLVPPGDAEALAKAIRRYLDNREFAEHLAESGREHVERHFSWGAIISKLQELYAGVVENGRSRVA